MLSTSSNVMSKYYIRIVMLLILPVFLYFCYRLSLFASSYSSIFKRQFNPGEIHESDYKVDWSAIPRRAEPPKESMHDKWIVITTINPPTSDIIKLAKIPGWKIVIVGDTKSPADWSHPNCIHLFVKDQLRLGYRTTNLIKFKSYARKNIGFLYAIQHGAKVIYETDDDNSPTKPEIGFDPQSKLSYLLYHAKDATVMNPYAHFGQTSIWPRGFPLDKIGDENTYQYRKCTGRALVQQGVVDGDPDVDAIFRLTRKRTAVNLKVNFDSASQPLMLPAGIMSPYNSQNTLHLYDAFWGLLLPQTVAFRVCDIWRGYWAQRLLWELNGNLVFFPPNAYTVRNSHSFLEDFIDERELYHLSSSLVEFLVKWKTTKTNFFDRIIDLSIQMAREGFWKKEDILLVKSWLIDLVSMGYQPPVLKTEGISCDKEIKVIKPKEQKTSNL